MKAGTLSQPVAQAAIETAEREIRGIERMQPAKEEKDTARVIRMLPRAAQVLRERIGGGNLGLRDPRSIVQGRNTLRAMSAFFVRESAGESAALPVGVRHHDVHTPLFVRRRLGPDRRGAYRGHVRGRAAEADLAAAPWHQSHDRAQGGCLPHAVTPEEGHCLALVHLHADTLQNVQFAIVNVDVREAKHARAA